MGEAKHTPQTVRRRGPSPCPALSRFGSLLSVLTILTPLMSIAEALSPDYMGSAAVRRSHRLEEPRLALALAFGIGFSTRNPVGISTTLVVGCRCHRLVCPGSSKRGSIGSVWGTRVARWKNEPSPNLHTHTS